MSAGVIQARYNDLDSVASRFSKQADAVAELNSRIRGCVGVLEHGDWEGQGSSAFFAEMNSTIYPAMQRLMQVLDDASSVTLEVKEILLRAEEEAASLFLYDGAAEVAAGASGAFAGATASASGSAGGGGGFLDSVGDALSSVGGGIADFFTGAYEEGKDMVVGIVNIVRDPVGTARGLAYAVTHPGEFWEAFKKPYVDAWENGRPWEAIGRGAMFVGSLLVGTKGADKVAKGAGVAGKAGEAAGLAGKAGRAGEIGETAGVAGRMVEFAGGKPAATTRAFVPDLSHVTGKGAQVRNAMIRDVIHNDIPNVRLTHMPQYNPFLEPFAVASRGQGTQLGKLAFQSRRQLIDTIVHEELHHRWWRRGLVDHHGPALDARFEQTIQRYMRMRGFR